MDEYDEGFENLIKRWYEFENTHTKRKNQEKVELFDKFIYKLLRECIIFTEYKLEVVRAENEIKVIIKSKEPLLLSCIEDKSLLKVAYLADAAFIEYECDFVCLKLYFNLEEYTEK